MHLPLAQVSTALQLHEWLQGSSVPLAAAAHPAGSILALARGHTLIVVPLLQDHHAPSVHAQLQQPHSQRYISLQQQAAAACHVHHFEEQITAVAWFVHLKLHKDISTLVNAASSHHLQQTSPAAVDQQSANIQPAEQVAGAESLWESELLLSGTAAGHLQLHTATGKLLYRQRLLGSSVLDVAVRPHCSGLRSSDASEEVCVTFSNALVRINTLDLRSLSVRLGSPYQVKMLQFVQQGNQSAAATIQPLAHTRYDFPAAVGPRVSGLSFGPLSIDLYSLLSSMPNSSGSARPPGGHKVSIITVGQSPCLAAFEAEERPNKSTLAAIVGMASSLTSGVAGAASKAAGLGPSMMYHGVRSLMKPLSSWYAASGNVSSHAATPSAAPQPVVCYDDIQQMPKPEPVSLSKQLRDDERVLEALVPAPVGTLLAAPDNLGRVLLLEGGSMAAVRMWKGYRDAQCGWILPAPGHPASPLELLLVLLAPKRQVVELWLPRSGQRLASRTVDYPCLLVPVGLPCGGWGNDSVMDAWQRSCKCPTTLVVNLQSGKVWDAIDCLQEE